LLYEDVEPGPWLATARKGTEIVARPTLFHVPSVTETHSLVQITEVSMTRLRAAVVLPEATLSGVLEQVVDRLAQDASDEDWELCLEYLSTLQDYPAQTFRVVSAVAKSCDAAALAAFLAVHETWFIPFARCLEKLSMAWFLIPVGSWMRAAQRFHVRARMQMERYVDEALPAEALKLLDPDARLREALDRLRRKLAEFMPALDCVLDAVGCRVNQRAPDSAHLQSAARGDWEALEGDLARAKNQLRIRHSSLETAEWPREDLDGVLQGFGVDMAIVRREPSDKSYARSVINGPIVAATIQVLGGHRTLPSDAVQSIKALRSFDPIWFDCAQSIETTRLVAKWLQEEHQ